MPQVKPEILSWARVTAGLSLEEAAAKLDINDARGERGADRLAALEAGAAEPSRPLLLRMVKHYRRPLLAFYLPEPPRPSERGHDFRTLPPDHSVRDDALVGALLRDVKARQEMVRALLETEDEALTLDFVGSMTPRDGAAPVMASIVERLGLDRGQFRNGVRGDRSALSGFAYLRERAEDAGIFVLLVGNLGSHHTAIDVELFRGFALADPVAPFIAINDQDSERAWSFTLLHELAHIWVGATGVSGNNPSSPVEQFCNDVAGQFLLPDAEVEREAGLGNSSTDAIMARIRDIADERQVSHSMVAYKLWRLNVISRDQWAQVSSAFRRFWLSNRDTAREENKSTKGPSYYVVRRHRLGGRLIELSRRMMADGALSPVKAARILSVKPSNVYPLVGSSGSAGRAA